MPNPSSGPPPATGLRRIGFIVAGCFFVGMAYIGAVMPGIPTTPWVLLASYCFGRSSPRLQRWLHRTPYFGGLLLDWHHHRGMRRSKKIIATILMLTAITLSIVLARLPDWVQWCIGGAGVVGLIVIWGFVKTVRVSQTMIRTLNESRLCDLLQRCGNGSNAPAAFARLSEAYSEAHRAYHNAAHIEDCLQVFDSVRSLAERPDEVEAAIWFHDVVYDPRAKDNEERSADWAAEELVACGASAEVVERVRDLILATRHVQPAETPDAQLLVDIDLSILGRDPEVFAAYDCAIAREYSWVPAEEYRTARIAVLERFLARPHIYQTVTFRERYEQPARRNLQLAIDALKSQSADG